MCIICVLLVLGFSELPRHIKTYQNDNSEDHSEKILKKLKGALFCLLFCSAALLDRRNFHDNPLHNFWGDG